MTQNADCYTATAVADVDISGGFSGNKMAYVETPGAATNLYNFAEVFTNIRDSTTAAFDKCLITECLILNTDCSTPLTSDYSSRLTIGAAPTFQTSYLPTLKVGFAVTSFCYSCKTY